MKVFISFSGARSRQLAVGLSEFLPDVIHSVKPFMSESDIEAGVRWPPTLDAELNGTNFGILCLTPENLNSPWILYEAGAIAKQAEISRVYPCLFGLQQSDLEFPLAYFQAKQATEDGIRAIVHSLNDSLGEQRRTGQQVDKTFETFWPPLDMVIKQISAESPIAAPNPVGRSDRDILDEILVLMRQKSTDSQKIRPTNPLRVPIQAAASFSKSMTLIGEKLKDANQAASASMQKPTVKAIEDALAAVSSGIESGIADVCGVGDAIRQLQTDLGNLAREENFNRDKFLAAIGLHRLQVARLNKVVTPYP